MSNKPVVRGIQVGLGLTLANIALKTFLPDTGLARTIAATSAGEQIGAGVVQPVRPLAARPLDLGLEAQLRAAGGLFDLETTRKGLGATAVVNGHVLTGTDIDQRLALLEDRYRTQFNALDGLLAQISSTGNFLTQQLAALPGANSSDK